MAVYLDNVFLFSQSLQAYQEHLTNVFDCLKTISLKLNPKKCKFMSEEVEYLGHIVTVQGLIPNKGNLDAVKEFPSPYRCKTSETIFDLTSHFQRFILSYAKTAQPLYYNLTKHRTPFVWTADCELAFDSLKSKLLMAPILTYLDFTKDFVLESDTNKQGLGAIFSQL